MEDQHKKTTAPHIKNKHTDDLVDHYWGSINYVASLIKASELKAGLILTFYGILLNFIYNHSQSVIESMTGLIGFYILSGLCFISIVVSVFYSVRCFMPRIEDKYDKSIFFFGDVISSYGDIRKFSKTFYEISMDEDRLFSQLGQKIFINCVWMIFINFIWHHCIIYENMLMSINISICSKTFIIVFMFG